MKKQALGVTLFAFAAVGVWIGCGGSSDSGVGSSSGDTPDGSGTGTANPPQPPPPPNNPPPPPPPPPAPPSTDGSSDVVVDGTAVSMTYGSCAAFTPCGGDPTGTWKYAAGGCIAEIDKSACPAATITNTNITVKGTVTFMGTNVSRSAQMSLSAKASIPASCTKGLPCSLIQAGLTQPPPTGLGMDTATCTAGASGSCDCDVGKTVTDVRSGTYTLTNGGHTIQTDDGRDYDFCVETAAPAKLTYKDVTPNTPIQATFVMNH